MSREFRFKDELIQLGSAHEKYGVRTRPKSCASLHFIYMTSVLNPQTLNSTLAIKQGKAKYQK